MHSLLPKRSDYSLAHPIYSLRRLCIIVSSMLILSACASSPSNQARPEVESRDIVSADKKPGACVGRGCADRGDTAQAHPEQNLALERARYFENQANLRNDLLAQIDARLNAAEYYIQAEQSDQAIALVQQLQSTVSLSGLTPTQRDRIDIIYAYHAYSNGDYRGTLQILDRLLPQQPTVEYVDPRTLPEYQERLERQAQELAQAGDQVSLGNGSEAENEVWERQVIEQPRVLEPVSLSPQQVDALLLSSFCYQALGQYDKQIDALIKREQGVTGTAQAQSIRYTWQVINALPALTREQIISLSPINSIKPRLEQSLASQTGAAISSVKPFTNLPNTLASQTSTERQEVEWTPDSIQQIAVLLPLSSKFKKAATAVLDGIQYEHEAQSGPYSPELLIYDIGENAFATPQYYQAAVNQGAQFVIGPLGKDFADQLITARQQFAMRNTPALVLGGSVPLDPYSTRMEFSPEREGQMIARKAFADGHLSAALITANDAKSQRIKSAFVNEWLSLGGRISAQTDYSPAQFDHTVELKLLFRAGASETRARRLADVLGYKPEHANYQRADIDFVLMTADAMSGRLLRPQINFFSGEKIPVYAGLDVYTGLADQINDMDLEGTRFPVMPWVLRSEQVSQYGGVLNQLFALGADAYRMASQYQRSSGRFKLRPDQIVEGYTGLLKLQADGNIESEPLWAAFDEGLARVRDNKGVDLTPIEPASEEIESSDPAMPSNIAPEDRSSQPQADSNLRLQRSL